MSREEVNKTIYKNKYDKEFSNTDSWVTYISDAKKEDKALLEIKEEVINLNYKRLFSNHNFIPLVLDIISFILSVIICIHYYPIIYDATILLVPLLILGYASLGFISLLPHGMGFAIFLVSLFIILMEYV